MQFEWDSNNIKHVSQDDPERENTLQEVESIFNDPNLIIKTGRTSGKEQRFDANWHGKLAESKSRYIHDP